MVEYGDRGDRSKLEQRDFGRGVLCGHFRASCAHAGVVPIGKARGHHYRRFVWVVLHCTSTTRLFEPNLDYAMGLLLPLQLLDCRQLCLGSRLPHSPYFQNSSMRGHSHAKYVLRNPFSAIATYIPCSPSLTTPIAPKR